jgi:hypothetical protein
MVYQIALQNVFVWRGGQGGWGTKQKNENLEAITEMDQNFLPL